MLMQQEINLYRYLTKQYQFHIRYKLVLCGYAIFFILLMLYYSYEVFQKHIQITTTKTLETELSQQQQRLDQITKQPLAPQNIEQAISAMGQLTPAAHEASVLLSQKKLSDYMVAFAKNIPNGIWITQIQLTKGGSGISLSGKSTQAIHPQKFAEQLNRDPFFMGKKFEVANLTYVKEPKTDIGYFNFQINIESSDRR